MRFAHWLAALVLLVASPVAAQSTLLQSGPVVGGHVPMYVNSSNSQAVVQDSGTAAGGGTGVGIKELGLTVRSSGTAPYADAGTGPNGENFCNYDGPITSTAGYHYLCMSPNAQGGGLISYGAGGAATDLPLQFLINGDLQTPATASGYVAGDVVCFSTTSQAIVPCPDQPGTMAYQNSNAINVTGVTQLTGVPAPSNNSDAANKAYVDAVSVGFNPLPASRLITTTALPTNTYDNGASGVGATLTATANGALSVDSTTVSVADVVVVNNEAAPARNGIYTVTATGSGGAPYVLTRATYFDTSAEMIANSFTSVTAGATEGGSSWIMRTAVATVGTTAVSFSLFTAAADRTLADGTIYIGNVSNVATSQTVSGDATLTNAGVLTVTKTNGVAFAASATTDTTVASNITSGTLPAARLPAPTASTLGGVQSYASVSNEFLTSITTGGVPVSAQPSFSNLSGSLTVAQGATGQTSYTQGDLLYATGTTTLAKLAKGTAAQVLTMNAGATAPSWAAIATLGSPTATTSGTAINYTSIPASARHISLSFAGVSTNGSDRWLIQLGDAGGIETSGYSGSAARVGTPSSSQDNNTNGAELNIGTNVAVVNGTATIDLLDSSTNTWSISVTVGDSAQTTVYWSGFSKSTSAALDRIRLTTTGGTDTFDAGKINISYW